MAPEMAAATTPTRGGGRAGQTVEEGLKGILGWILLGHVGQAIFLARA